MTLLDRICEVLDKAGQPLTVREIAAGLRKHGWVPPTEAAKANVVSYLTQFLSAKWQKDDPHGMRTLETTISPLGSVVQRYGLKKLRV